jgi:SAM-dependent methyltransferase
MAEYASVFDYPEVWYGLEERLNAEDGGNRRGDYGDATWADYLLKRYSPHDTRNLIEVCCGNAPHGRLLAMAGYDVTGYDYSRAMLDAARKAAFADGVKLRLYLRDSENFTLPNAPFDAAVCLAETQPCGFHARNGFEYNHATVSHLKCMHQALKPGAIYLQDWGYDLEIDLRRVTETEVWNVGSIPLPGVGLVHRTFYVTPDDILGNMRTHHQECVIEFDDGRVVETYDRWREPLYYTVAYHDLLCRMAGFEVIAAHCQNVKEPGLHDLSNPVWLVLQRT